MERYHAMSVQSSRSRRAGCASTSVVGFRFRRPWRGPVECCKIIFAAQNNNIDSAMNAGTHRFTYRKQRECHFDHRLREGGAFPKSHRQEEVINMPPLTKTPSTKVPAKIGRPTKYSPEWAERFCELLAQGQSVRQICSQPGQPDKSQVYRWLEENGDFRDQYARARGASRQVLQGMH